MGERSRPERRGAAQEGATATEYVFLLVFIALVITAGVAAFGTELGALYGEVADEVPSAPGGS